MPNERQASFILRVEFTREQAQAIANMSKRYCVDPESYVRHAALNAATADQLDADASARRKFRDGNF